MSLGERLRRAYLRWSRLGAAGLLVLPFAVTSLLGFLWLHDRGMLLYFVLGCVGLAGGIWSGRLGLAWQQRRKARVEALARGETIPPDDDAEDPAGLRERLANPPIDPEWSERETAIYEAARAAIAERLPAPVDWESLPEHAVAVVEDVAGRMSDGKRGALDFTLPEALLLIDRVALRYREFLRSHVPFSDQFSMRSVHWLWSRQDQARAAWKYGYLAYRGLRLAFNPPVGVLRELERAATAGLQDRLSDQVVRDAQAILLEEVAQAAVDLYSGRLKFSDAELIEIQLGSELRDRLSLARPDDPVRIIVVGQISAGKSTLINALAGDGVAETDLAPTTDRLTAHELVIDEIPCRLVDTMGLDGSAKVQELLAQEISQADMVLWALRANRPGRAVDIGLRDAVMAWYAQDAARRIPPIIPVATAADALLPDWPYTENRLPEAAQAVIGKAVAALRKDFAGPLGDRPPIPVCARPPSWNLDTLHNAIAAQLGEALMAQRNRRRLESPQGLRFGENLGRAGRGVAKGVKVFGGRLWQAARKYDPGDAAPATEIAPLPDPADRPPGAKPKGKS
jgi:predicted GTPase